MFERYTDEARRVVVLAHEEARRLGHDYTGTEHLLLGLIGETTGAAGQALRALGIELDAARAQVEQIIGRGAPGRLPTGHLPFTPRTKKVLELASRESRDLGHDDIETEHILLALMREGDGVAAQMLHQAGLDFTGVQDQLRQLRRGVPAAGRPAAGPRAEKVARRPGAPGRDDLLMRRLASFADRLTAIEQRLNESAPGEAGG